MGGALSNHVSPYFIYLVQGIDNVVCYVAPGFNLKSSLCELVVHLLHCFWVSHVWLVVVVISGTLDSQGPSGEPQYGSPLPLPKRRIRKREGLDPNAQE